MKTRLFFACFIACVYSLLLNAAAAGYTDDMSSSDNTGFTMYNNLSAQSYRSAAALPDPTALTFTDISKPVGSAVYLATGVQTVKAAIYTHVGTLVTQQPNSGQYMLGVFQSNIDETLTNGPLQALYCTATGGVYTLAGGLKQVATDMINYPFVPVITPPQGETIGYGVNIYYSADGSAFTRAAITNFTYNYNVSIPFFYEEYSAAVPAAAKMIKVEINDAYAIPLVGGGATPNERRYMTSLASVSLSGSGMSLGAAEPGAEQPPPEATATPSPAAKEQAAEEAAAETYASQRHVKSKADEYDVKDDEEYIDAAKAEDSQKPESSSKFSGTITSSSKERDSSSSRSSSKSAGSSSEAAPAPSAEAMARVESPTYKIDRGGENPLFNGAIVAYIIIISLIVIAVVVLPKKK